MAYMVAAMLTPYRSMIKVATPVVTNLWKERDMEGMRRISREMSLVNLIVGIVSGILGGWILSLLGLVAVGTLGSLIASVVGAVVLLWIASLLARSSKKHSSQ